MRTERILTLLLATSMLICLIPVATAASAPTNGGVYNVSTDETWNIGSELDAIVTVEAGATLTIATDYTLPVGASITVAEGGTLRVEDGSLTGGDFPQVVRMTPNEPTSLVAHSSVATGAFSLRIVAPSGNEFQYSYSPIVVGALETFGYAYNDKSTTSLVGLYISKYLLFDEPSAYSEKNKLAAPEKSYIHELSFSSASLL